MVQWKVLAIDDDTSLLALLKIGLEREGFQVTTARSGEDGLRKAYALHPDAVILDVLMPQMDGWTTCQRLRQVCDTPVIMLTARSNKEELVKGLSLGADDYLTKPCSFEELKARIRSACRRRSQRLAREPSAVYDDGNLYVNLVNAEVRLQGEVIHLTPTESRLMMYLVSHAGAIVPHRELLINVWGPEYAGETKYLGVYIRYLRKKVEADPSHPVYIQTKHRVGYCFSNYPVLS